MADSLETLDRSLSSNTRKPRRIIKRTLLVGLALIILGVLGYAMARMMIGPSEGTVVNAIPENIAHPKPVVELEQFEGTHLTFAYPTTFHVQPTNKDNPNSLETHLLIASGMMNKIVTITVVALPSGRLEDDASYLMRSLHPETYKLSTQTIQSEKVIVALNAKDSQQVAFWVHSKKLLTFAISSVTINSEATVQEYQKMLESVRWR